ncbi:MAG: CDP-diacylglycerol--serine O-phosphatidyltransferase [Bacteroidales bacterium]|nr:CDP-diacylglycerol--serine O-phosphatidyltransferase [Bacteroidales bacterium]
MPAIRHFPNAITCCNLFCGCVSAVFAFSGQLELAAYFIFSAAVFDFFDGFVARRLKICSAMGKELDSLADMVSFGMAPASIMFALLLKASDNNQYVALPAFIIAVFSALRLAKFNIDPRQTESFIGLPTPANAFFICAFAFPEFEVFAAHTYFLWAVTAVFSYLLVAELPLFSLKFKTFDWANNKTRYIFLALSLALLIVFRWAGMAPIILLYILLSVLSRMLGGSTQKHAHG